MKSNDNYQMREATEEEYIEHMKALAEEKKGFACYYLKKLNSLKKKDV